MRPIDADALKQHMGIEDAVKYGNETEEQQHNSYATLMNYEIADYIDDMPTLDFEPVRHGKLKHVGFLTCQCSVCKTIFHELPYENFCPNCGAKMDGGKTDV